MGRYFVLCTIRLTSGASELTGQSERSLGRMGPMRPQRCLDPFHVVQQTNQPLYRAYLLKEQLRLIFQLPLEEVLNHLELWLQWAQDLELIPKVSPDLWRSGTPSPPPASCGPRSSTTSKSLRSSEPGGGSEAPDHQISRRHFRDKL
jgi:hypothetical protein